MRNDRVGPEGESRTPVWEGLMAKMAEAERGISGNFQQKKYPVNPISYMRDHGINNIFRYVQTHPDIDHMDGIEALFDEFSPTNFYDTDNTKGPSGSLPASTRRRRRSIPSWISWASPRRSRRPHRIYAGAL